METTFITIHDLSRDARILYSSDSIVDILGHTPDEVIGRSAWDFFHPEELPVAKELHSRGVRLDKAAVLAYCRIRNRQGDWVTCECCFSVVYDVMVCCTSIYRNPATDPASARRHADAPVIRRIFSSSPKDPRYHMLTHLSGKFSMGPEDQTHEPRAALFLNRFTRTLTIMYATSGIEQIIGIPSEDMKGRSFYYCIQQNCLQDAVRCLEQAKGNDSIAYMRFFFRDPRQDDPPSGTDSGGEGDTDESMTDVTTEDEDEGAVGLDHPGSSNANGSTSRATGSGSRSAGPTTSVSGSAMETDGSGHAAGGSGSGSASTSTGSHAPPSLPARFSLSGHPGSPSVGSSTDGGQAEEPLELEAVVSCTSDGLVVCLRRAHPPKPPSLPAPPQPPEPAFRHVGGFFAAPWALEPQRNLGAAFGPPYGGIAAGPAGGPMADYGFGNNPAVVAMRAAEQRAKDEAVMRAIRDTAVFAWGLTGINGTLVNYSRGHPGGESQPPSGFPVWASDSRASGTPADSGIAVGGLSAAGEQPPFGDPGMGGSRSGTSS